MNKLSATFMVLMLPTAALAQALPQYTPDWEGLARIIVERLDPQPGEKILILSHPGRFDPLIPPLRYALNQAGAVDLGNLEVLPLPFPEEWDAQSLQQSLPQVRGALADMFEDVDAVVKLPGSQSSAAYVAAQDLLRQNRARTVHFHWEGAYPLHGQPLPPQFVIDRVYQKAVLDTDYAALKAVQQRFEQALRDSVIEVVTPAGTQLRFSIGDRPVTRQDGDASAHRVATARNLIDREIELPAGAIRVAPVEETVSGRIVIPLSRWNGYPVTQLQLEFESGQLVRFSAATGEDAVRAELKAGEPAARAFREFALGFNPRLVIPERDAWIPYYGYGAGVVRLSLGDNTELGGRVSGGYVRWNFFVDATVRVGDEVWVKDGKLIK